MRSRKIWCIFLDTKCLISFPLEDKHVVNEQYIVKKKIMTRQKKCPHMVHFNVPGDWFETNLQYQKRHFEGSQKFVGVAVYWEEEWCCRLGQDT